MAESSPAVRGADLQVTDTERAVLNTDSAANMWSVFDAYVQARLGAAIARVCFRSGRIDVVWGVELTDGRQVVIKAHRPPVDLTAVRAAGDAMRFLRVDDFPCADPLSGPDQVDDHVLSLETLIAQGAKPDGRDPHIRRLLAVGLARHIDVLRQHPELALRAGSGPAWCQYQSGPWPVPHDPIVDFRFTPDGYGWLDSYAERVRDQILFNRAGSDVVVGHADWYAGNATVDEGALVGTFDWELVADADAVIAGFTAAGFASSSTRGGGLSSPEEVAEFLSDYEAARGATFTTQERRAAAGAAAWILAFNARWELGMGADGREVGTSLWLMRERSDDYVALTW